MSKRINTAVWQEKYKRWQINVQKDGIRKSFYSSTPGRTGQREANKKADQWLDGDIQNPSAAVNVLYAAYLESVRQTTSTSNFLKIKSIGEVWILPNIGHLKIGKLTEAHLQKIIDSACAKGLAKKSLLNIRATIMAFVKYCRKAKATDLIPEDLTIPHSARSKGHRILQPDDLKTLFTVDSTIYNGKRIKDPLINAYRFQVLTGLRPGELFDLKWSNIKGRAVKITGSQNWLGEITNGKNENALRRFTMCENAYQVLQDQRAMKINNSIYVFGELSQSLYYNAWKRYCKSNGLSDVTPYELRHTFVSIAKQLPEGDVKALVGHSQSMDTFGIYGHEMTGDADRVADNLNTVFDTILG